MQTVVHCCFYDRRPLSSLSFMLLPTLFDFVEGSPEMLFINVSLTNPERLATSANDNLKKCI